MPKAVDTIKARMQNLFTGMFHTGASMSRVIGGSSSNEAYTRMLEELKQKNSEKINQEYQQERRIRIFNDDATYRQTQRRDSMESLDRENQRRERQQERNRIDFYA